MGNEGVRGRCLGKGQHTQTHSCWLLPWQSPTKETVKCPHCFQWIPKVTFISSPCVTHTEPLSVHILYALILERDFSGLKLELWDMLDSCLSSLSQPQDPLYHKTLSIVLQSLFSFGTRALSRYLFSCYPSLLFRALICFSLEQLQPILSQTYSTSEQLNYKRLQEVARQSLRQEKIWWTVSTGPMGKLCRSQVTAYRLMHRIRWNLSLIQKKYYFIQHFSVHL